MGYPEVGLRTFAITARGLRPAVVQLLLSTTMTFYSWIAEADQGFNIHDAQANVSERPALLQESVVVALIDMANSVIQKNREPPIICVGASVDVDEAASARGFATVDLEPRSFRELQKRIGAFATLHQQSECVIQGWDAFDDAGRDAWLVTYTDSDVLLVEFYAHFNKPVPKLSLRPSLSENRGDSQKTEWDGYGIIDHDGDEQYFDYDFVERDGLAVISRSEHELVIR